MKKINLLIKILILTPVLTISCTNSKFEDITEDIYVSIPDTKFEEKLIELGIDSDGIINQKALKIDVSNVEYLNLNNTSSNIITDLKGIEAFVNLKRLYASGNELTTIDLSNNILLDTINLSVNKLTSIKGLSNINNLKWLSLSYNYFTEFVIDNSSIENILMSDNYLVSFDASKAPKLGSALLSLNKIEYLDFSKNTLLKTLVFSANKVKTINLDNNLNLKYIYCSSNLLEAFDVSKLNKLIDLRIDRNPDLSCIKIATSQNIPILKLSPYQQTNVNCN
ncbi:hypothetical protein GGR42_000382 [Saonia flava]|uniref:Uncharacterized protein n=1 Tax=Saonia flava TaxID=523696 RepID=A0A846QSH8_9FLAO|nr:hypothetical protein [Saonia flava]NJB69920.1 hypothetical protein [Saonia flava]